jgi:integrase
MATFRAVILRGKNQIRSDGFTQVKIKITQNRVAAYIPTDLYVRPGDFRAGFTTGQDASWINGRILTYLKVFTDRYIKLGDVSYEMTAHEIRKAVTTEDEKQRIDFIAFAESHLKRLSDENRIGTLRGYKWVIEHIKKFHSPLYFDEIDSAFLVSFEKYMRRQGMRNAIPTYMAKLRVIFNAGMKEHNDEDRGIIIISNYPFRKYKIRTAEHDANTHSLTVDQLRKLLNYPAKYTREKLAIDVFTIMLCLMGPNTKDIFLMKKPVKGRVNYSRSKTGHKFSVKIEPELTEIIVNYSGEKLMFDFSQKYKDDQLFQKAVNMGLKSICKKNGWDNITSNWARHTWATLCRTDLNINREDISRCLGHRSISVTDQYIRYNYEIEDKVNRKLLDHVFRPTIEKELVRMLSAVSNN